MYAISRPKFFIFCHNSQMTSKCRIADNLSLPAPKYPIGIHIVTLKTEFTIEGIDSNYTKLEI